VHGSTGPDPAGTRTTRPVDTGPRPPVDTAPARPDGSLDAAEAVPGGPPTATAEAVPGGPPTAGDAVDSQLLVRAVALLSHAATQEFSVDDLLHRLCEVAADTLGVDGASVMSFDGTRPRFVRASRPLLVGVEALQESLQSGPCHDCIVGGQPVAAPDIADAGRWPEFTALAADAGLHSVLAVPLRSRGRSWGALDLYRLAVSDWTPAEVSAAQLLADVAVSYVVMAVDRDAARTAQQERARRSLHDQLTGLPNRGLLFDRIEHALTAARRHGTAVAVLFIDLDRFKDVNDTFGHAAGDVVLATVADRLARTLRQGDTVARLAGDEFVLLCEDVSRAGTATPLDTLQTVTDRVRAALAEPIPVAGVDLVVSASIGVAVADDQLAAVDLLHDADTAMYRAKSEGRNRVAVHDPDSGVVVGLRWELERTLPGALDRGELRVHHQPIVSTRDGRVVAVEALLRWQHPTHGLLPAADFIAVAEDTGSLAPIGRWVIGQACAQLACWRRAVGTRAPSTVFVNLRPRELVDPALTDTVAASLRTHGLAPGDLGFEVLEAQFGDPGLTAVLSRWQDRGHPLSIDDFGTGYSSLSRLVGLPVAYAKIDRGFVGGLPGDPRSRALVDAVLTVGRSLGLQVVGEGVETAAQLAHLTAAGCELVQGLHVGRPVPGPELTSALAGTPAGP